MELAVPDEETLRAQQAAFDDVTEQLADLDDNMLADAQRKQAFASHVFSYFEDTVDWDLYSDTEEDDFEFLQTSHEVALAAMDCEVPRRALANLDRKSGNPMRLF